MKRVLLRHRAARSGRRPRRLSHLSEPAERVPGVHEHGLLLVPRLVVLEQLHSLAVPERQGLRPGFRVRHQPERLDVPHLRARRAALGDASPPGDCSVTGCPAGQICKLANGVAQCVTLGGGDDGRRQGVDAAGDSASGEGGTTSEGGRRRERRRVRRRRAVQRRCDCGGDRRQVHRRPVHGAGSSSARTASSATSSGSACVDGVCEAHCSSSAPCPTGYSVRPHARRVQHQPEHVLRLGRLDLPRRHHVRRSALRSPVRRQRRRSGVPVRAGVRQRRLHPRPGRDLRLHQRRPERSARDHVRGHLDLPPPRLLRRVRRRCGAATCSAAPAVGLQERDDRDGHVLGVRHVDHARQRLRPAQGKYCSGGKVCVDGYCD